MAVCNTGNQWRWVVCDLDSSPITILDRVAHDRSIEYELNTPTLVTGEVFSGNPEINITHTDGFPFLTEGDRLLYCFRRDYDGNIGNDPWTVRAAGTILQLEDAGTPDDARTRFVAYDPWQRLYGLPVYNALDPTGNSDTTYTDDAAQIVVDLVAQAEVQYTFVGPGGTGIDIVNGTIEVLPSITHTFQREMSIGQAWDDLCARGVCDIVLTPVYDPINRPGILCELNVYAQAGAQKPEAIFAWDKPSRSVVNMNRTVDGTQRANKIRFHRGQGGLAIGTRTNAASITRFGEYWIAQFIVDGLELTDVEDEADELLSQVSEHRRIVSFDPTPERSPLPFIEYYLGDSVRVFSSKQFRAAQSGFQRVTGFTVELSDNALETIRDVRVYIPNESEEIPEGFSGTQELSVQLAGEQANRNHARTRSRLGSPIGV